MGFALERWVEVLCRQVAQALLCCSILPICAVFIQDPVLLAVQCALALIMIIYVPYAAYIALRDRYVSNKPFDCAAGEVAYLALGMTAWLATAVYTTTYLSIVDRCNDGWTNSSGTWLAADLSCFNAYAANAAIAFAQCGISAIWLGMIVWMVHRTPIRRKEAFKISVNILLRGVGEGSYNKKSRGDPDGEAAAGMAMSVPPPRPSQVPLDFSCVESPPYRLVDEAAAFAGPSNPMSAPAYDSVQQKEDSKESPASHYNYRARDFSDMKTEVISHSF